ncbi:MAG: hypothetical protein EOM91_00125 [Sphingobacteriia bacterium]|nr:hypothetical protein [Sphingobacteriia bacterium]NCC39020.1 hypothetical protein [Gammaproteobacteria bacterium]
MIYAPLFIGLTELFQALDLGPWSLVLAAALAGAIGAALYGAREISLIASAIGVGVGVLSLMLLAEHAAVLGVVLVAGVVAGGVGLLVRFPARCSRHVPGKTLAGLATGALCGAVLALAEPFHTSPFSSFGLLAFLVSVNGILYVATVRWWLILSYRLHCESRPCFVIEALVMSSLAALAAGSVWLVIGPLLQLQEGLWQVASSGLHEEVVAAALGGMLGGWIGGLLMEFFRFSWVHDL